MTTDIKIVVIGAGSASFGLETLTGIMSKESLQGATLCFVDINDEHLKTITALARLINKKWQSNMKIIATNDRKEVLEGADFVILSVAQDREETWIKDIEIAKKYGIVHYGENGGPGSFSHTARGLAFIMPILYDIHDLAPHAWLLNYTNPVPRISYAAEYAGVKSISLCHQYWYGYGIIGRYLAQELKINKYLDLEVEWKDESFDKLHYFAVKAHKNYDAKFAGLNHFIWTIDVRKRDSWVDMYPQIMQNQANKKIYDKFEPLTQHMFEVFKLLPAPGDSHLAEYLPYTATHESWNYYKIQMYDFARGKLERQAMWERIRGIIQGTRQFDLEVNDVERAHHIISEIATNANAYEPSVNIRNNGAISNLPNDAIVEVPAWVTSKNVTGMKIGKLPEAVAALCRREISIAKLITKASIEGDKTAAVQAFSLDPMVNDLRTAEDLVEDYVNEHSKYLPQFRS